MASQRDRAQAASDLNAKLRLEAVLRPKVRRAQNATVREATRVLAATGRLPDISAIAAEAFEPILRAHYDEVADVFDHRVSDQLPRDVAISNEEKAAIAAGLLLFFDARAPEQAERIGRTSERNARRSVALANQESARIFEDEGRALSLVEEAAVAGTFFSRSERGRTTGIVMLETQASAEASKLKESRVLVGDSTPIDRASPEESPAGQEWVDVGDDLVRTAPFSHRSTTIDRVLVGEPFNVGGEFLLYPGDTSLGASMSNVANCRCSAVADVGAIVDHRREVQAEAVGQDFAPGQAPVSLAPPGDDPVPITAPAPRPSTRPRPADPPTPAAPAPGQPDLDADTSLGKWTNPSTGSLLPERAALHDEILDDFVEGAVVKPSKTLQLVGGGPASGKGTAIGSGQVNLPTKAVGVDADAIKAKLPEFQVASAAKDSNGAAFVHAESSKISDKLLTRAKNDGLDTILDGTGNGSLDKLKRRVQPFKDAGYRVQADYVTVPTDVAVERAFKRGQETGRFVPESVTREIHAGVSKTFPQAARADLFDEVRLFDTDVAFGDAPFLIYERVDGVERIVDQTKWEAFLAKGVE